MVKDLSLPYYCTKLLLHVLTVLGTLSSAAQLEPSSNEMLLDPFYMIRCFFVTTDT